MSGQEEFCKAIENQINYFSQEFDLTYLEAIGVLTYLSNCLSMEAMESNFDDWDDDSTWVPTEDI